MSAKTILVIGGGPAGVEASLAAAQSDATVTLISDTPIGGRAGWHSLLPSKVWLTAADTLALSQHGPQLGVESLAATANTEQVVSRIKNVAAQWNTQQRDQLIEAGVELVVGLASFAGPDEVVISDGQDHVISRRKADAIILAGGSMPFFPPKLKPDGKRILAPRFAGHLQALPGSAVVIGAGPTGSEFVYLFNRLGVKVTWIVDQYGVLPGFDPAAGAFLRDVLVSRGVKIVAEQLAEEINVTEDGVQVQTNTGMTCEADIAFVAIGRFPDLSRLNMPAAGFDLPPRQAPAVDGYGQTDVPGIYVVGDAAGAPMVANRALAQAWVAGRHAAGLDTPPFNPDAVVYATYTEPQVAQVGQVQGDGLRRTHLSFNATLKAQLLPESAGFLDLTYDSEGVICGATAVGLHAADVLTPIALAVQQHLSLTDMAALYAAYPTLSELAFIAARTALNDIQGK